MSAVTIGFSNFWAALMSRIANFPLLPTSIFLPSNVTSNPITSSSTAFSSRSAKSKYTIALLSSPDPVRGCRR